MFRKFCISFILLIIFQSDVQAYEVKAEPKNKDDFKRFIDHELNPSCPIDGCDCILGTVSYYTEKDNSYKRMTISNKEMLIESFPVKRLNHKEAFTEIEEFLDGKKVLLGENITNLGAVFKRSDDVIEYDLIYAGEIAKSIIQYPKTSKARFIYIITIDSPIPFGIQVYANKKEAWISGVGATFEEDDFILLEVEPISINTEIEKYQKICFKNNNPTNCLIQAIKNDKKIQKAIYKETQQLVKTFELK